MYRPSLYLGVIETYGHDIATHRSIEMAISVFTDAETDTPCIYDTVLHINVPRVHSNITTRRRENKSGIQIKLKINGCDKRQ